MIGDYYQAFTLQRQSAASIMAEPAYSDIGVYRGLIQPRSGNETGVFNAIDESYRNVLYTDVSTPVQYGDRIVQSGVTWRAVFVSQPIGIAGQSHHKEVGLSYVGG